MFPLIALSCLLCVGFSQGQTLPEETSQCIRDTWDFIKNVLDKEAMSLQLDPNSGLAAKNLMNGKIMSMTPFEWDHFAVKSDNAEDFLIRTRFMFQKMEILYKCNPGYKSLNWKPCTDIDITISDLKFSTDLKVNKSTGLLTLDDVKLWSGNFNLDGFKSTYTLTDGDDKEAARDMISGYIKQLINNREVILPMKVLSNCK